MLRALGTDCPSARWLQHHHALDVLETKGMSCAPPVNVSERSTAGPRPGCSGVRWDSFDTAGSAVSLDGELGQQQKMENVTQKHSSGWASTWLTPEETLPQEAQDGMTFAVMEPSFLASSWVPW